MAYLIGGIGAGVLITVGMFYWNIWRHKRQKKIPSLTKYVVFSIAILIIYSLAEFIETSINGVNGVSHDTLTTCIFGCFGGEILSCALIKIFKLRGENNDE